MEQYSSVIRPPQRAVHSSAKIPYAPISQDCRMMRHANTCKGLLQSLSTSFTKLNPKFNLNISIVGTQTETQYIYIYIYVYIYMQSMVNGTHIEVMSTTSNKLQALNCLASENTQVRRLQEADELTPLEVKNLW
eukprot:GHVN01103006.1.p2 GENE.GHVN01103006.1~~GHVN01103006.1.p2  ORF type:complete len:134 (+),score=5.43 GHVN01103006.1:2780-3181(+)